MNPITLLTLFFGYLLVYGSVANHGVFATNPWGGVLRDAYTGEMAPVNPTAPQGQPTNGTAA